MELVTVESSMIHAVGYDKEKRILEIVFNTGRTYQYGDVPPEVYEGLLNAESKGPLLFGQHSGRVSILAVGTLAAAMSALTHSQGWLTLCRTTRRTGEGNTFC